MKSAHKVKIMIALACFVLSLTTCGFVLPQATEAQAYAASSTQDELLAKTVEFTQDDNFMYQGSTYSIHNYANSISSGKGLFGKTVTYFDNTCAITGDDPITKIFPRNIFVVKELIHI